MLLSTYYAQNYAITCQGVITVGETESVYVYIG